LERATEYTFEIGAGAQSAEGVALAEPFSLALRTTGYLEVSEVLPAPRSEAVSTGSVITVIFNRPVVPLVSVEDMGDLPHPLTFDPPVEGEGEWLNTSIYQFTPEGLSGGTTYTVTVEGGLEDVTGGVLQDDFVWSFSTLPPEILDIEPETDESRVLLEAPVEITFSQPMDPAAVEQAFQLVSLGTDPLLVPIEPVPVAGSFEWNSSNTVMTFQPDDMLELITTYRLTLDGEQALSATGAPLAASWESEFVTLPPPNIVATSPADGTMDASPY